MVAQFLQMNYDQFFSKYNNLLKSNNYVAKRQSIKLLGEILLDRANYTIMTMYVDSADHLKLTMNLLRDKSRNVQYEAFHVFKVWKSTTLPGWIYLTSSRFLLRIPRNPRPCKIFLSRIERNYLIFFQSSTLSDGVRGSWLLQYHINC